MKNYDPIHKDHLDFSIQAEYQAYQLSQQLLCTLDTGWDGIAKEALDEAKLLLDHCDMHQIDLSLLPTRSHSLTVLSRLGHWEAKEYINPEQLESIFDLYMNRLIVASPPNAKPDDETALHMVTHMGSLWMTKKLVLDHHLDVNALCSSGTPLNSAAGGRRHALEMVLFLIDQGANPYLLTEEGYSILHRAVYKKNHALARHLIQHYPDMLCMEDVYGKLPEDLALIASKYGTSSSLETDTAPMTREDLASARLAFSEKKALEDILPVIASSPSISRLPLDEKTVSPFKRTL